MRSPFPLAIALIAALAAHGCAPAEEEDVSTDAAFLSDYVDDYENDAEEDAAQANLEARVEASDELDDGAAAKRTHGAVSILQDDAYLGSYDDASSKAHYADARALGPDVIRLGVIWQAAAPAGTSLTRPAFDAADPAGYDWSSVDRRYDNARAAGLRVLVTIHSPIPHWASEEPARCKDNPHCAWKPKPREHAAFVTALGRHLKAKGPVWAFTLWNEPNLGFFLGGEDDVARGMRYRKFWFQGLKALRKTAGQRTARVFFGDMANGAHSPDHWAVFHYALCLPSPNKDARPPCAAHPRKVYTAGIAFHPYAPSPRGVENAYETMLGFVDDASRAGRLSANRPVYLTEHAFLTRGLVEPAPSAGLGAPGNIVTPAEQATYDDQVDHAVFAHPRVRSLAQFGVMDEGDGKWDSGLRFNDIVHPTNPRKGEAKPAWYSYRLAIDVTRVDGDTVLVFGHARACRSAFVVEGRATATKAWSVRATVATDDLGYATKSLPSAGIDAWRLRCSSDATIASRETGARTP